MLLPLIKSPVHRNLRAVADTRRRGNRAWNTELAKGISGHKIGGNVLRKGYIATRLPGQTIQIALII